MPQNSMIKPVNFKIMLLAGEASGDQHGAEMAKEILHLNPDVELLGMGSQHMQKAGVSVFFDSASIAAMGIVEIAKHWGEIKGAMALVKQKLDAEKPDLLVCIDYQEFNQKMAAYAKSRGIKVLFYIGPQVWAWRPKRVRKVGLRIDHMAVIFPFEVDFYQQHGIPVTYVGHPLVDKVPKPNAIKPIAALNNGLKTVGLFPGSRHSELSRLLPVMMEAALLLKQRYGNSLQFVLPLADTLDKTQVKALIANYDLDVHLFEQQLYPLIKSCDAIMSCSGTVTLEIALLNVPMCVVYKQSWLTHQIMRRLMIIEHFCLVNIIARKLVVKEMLQDDASAENIALEIQHILDDSHYSAHIKQHLCVVSEQLGEGGGSKNIAQLALSLMA